MVDPEKTDALELFEYVKSLEGKESIARGNQVISILNSLGIKSNIQQNRFPRIRNIIIDFSSRKGKRLIFSAHYDKVNGSPGANDNASGVAVLLGLCRILKPQEAPVRVIFFDREEAWLRSRFLHPGLLGSLYYVFRNNLRDISAVYNLEFCGTGDCCTIWPIKNYQKDLAAYKAVERAAAALKLDLNAAHIPWLLFSSDHLSFRLKGLPNAVTLSLLPIEQIPAVKNLVSNLNLHRILSGRKPLLPGVLASLHTPEDTVSHLSEGSLKLMLSLLIDIIHDFSSRHEK